MVPVRIAIIGTGGMGRQYAALLAGPQNDTAYRPGTV